MDSINSAIIYSHNSSYAYKFRTKVGALGVVTEYKRTLTELINYMLDNENGIVFIDSRSINLISCLKKFSLIQKYKNFSIVFLSDNYNNMIDCDNIFTFSSTFDRIAETIERIKSIMMSRSNRIDNIKDKDVDSCIRLIIDNFHITSSLTGYNYIVECAKVFLLSRDKKYSIIKEAYKAVANRFGKTVSNIEKSIRTAISSGISKGRDVFFEVFNHDKVSNATFMNFVVNKVKSVYF